MYWLYVHICIKSNWYFLAQIGEMLLDRIRCSFRVVGLMLIDVKLHFEPNINIFYIIFLSNFDMSFPNL